VIFRFHEFGWPGAFFGVFTLWIFLSAVFEIFMLIDAIRRLDSDFDTPGSKSGWIAGLIIGFLFIVPVGFAISIAYLFIVRIPASRKARAHVHSPYPPAGPIAPPPAAPAEPGPYCRNCGAKLVAGAHFCHFCGAAV
jgi:zinc-ribbon domain